MRALLFLLLCAARAGPVSDPCLSSRNAGRCYRQAYVDHHHHPCAGMYAPPEQCAAVPAGDWRLEQLLGGDAQRCEHAGQFLAAPPPPDCPLAPSGEGDVTLGRDGRLHAHEALSGLSFVRTVGQRRWQRVVAPLAGFSRGDVGMAAWPGGFVVRPEAFCEPPRPRAVAPAPDAPNIVLLILDSVSACALERFAPRLAEALRPHVFSRFHSIHFDSTKWHTLAALGGVRYAPRGADLGVPARGPWIWDVLRERAGYDSARIGRVAADLLPDADFDCALPLLTAAGTEPCAPEGAQLAAARELDVVAELLRAREAPVFVHSHTAYAHAGLDAGAAAYDVWADALPALLDADAHGGRRTVVLLMGDHGPKVDAAQHNWPLLALLGAPGPAARANAGRLVAAWDIYATLQDLAGLPFQPWRGAQAAWPAVRPHSLARAGLPDRTLDEAGIARPLALADQAPQPPADDLREALRDKFERHLAAAQHARCPRMALSGLDWWRSYHASGLALVTARFTLDVAGRAGPVRGSTALTVGADSTVIGFNARLFTLWAANAGCAPKGARAAWCWCGA